MDSSVWKLKMPHFKKLIVLLSLAAAGCVSHSHHSSHRESAGLDRPVWHNRTLEAEAETPITPGHPRLFVRGAFTPALPGDPQVVQWQRILAGRADELLTKPVIAYTPQKLLGQSREALRRLSLLGGMYQLTHEPRYAQAGRRELLNVCEFPDWQPNDFLATAEMMNAAGIGYDWLFDALSPQERATVVTAIVNNGLEPAMNAYASQGGWTTAHHNWNMVCNGGVIVASLAIAEERPAVARRALNAALGSLPNGLQAYDENGGTPEGPMYHNYATRYLTFAAAALQTALQTPISLAGSFPNWTHAGDFRINLRGPSGKVFNFGDGADIVGNSAWMFWHAARFGHPEYATFEKKEDQSEPSIFDLLWYVPGDPAIHPPLDETFEAALVMRQRWDDPNTTYLALRKGSNADNHNHLDLGTFVLDMLGERFAQELGADNYDLPGYLGARKADYLRSSTPGQNTLTIGNASQPLTAGATGELVAGADGQHIARIDLTIAYPGARSATRTAGINARGVAFVRDDIRLTYPGTIIWNLHTPALVTPTPDGGAILDVQGHRVEMRVLQPIGARLTFAPDRTAPPELPIQGSTHIRLICPASTETRIDVEFRPLSR